MRIAKRIPATSANISGAGGVTSGLYQGSGGLYFTVGEVGVLSRATQVYLDMRSTSLKNNGDVHQVRSFVYQDDTTNLRPNQVRVELHRQQLASGSQTWSEVGSGTSLSGASFVIDAEAEI